MSGTRSSVVMSLALIGAFIPWSAHAALQISSAATRNVTCSAGICSATASSATLNVDDLVAMLGDGDVTVATGNAARDIQIKAAVSWANTSRLTLDSYRSILIRQPVTLVGSGALTIKTKDGGFTGDFGFLGKGRVEFGDIQSSLIINGASYTLIDRFSELVAFARHDGFGNVALARSIHARKTPYPQSPMIGFSGTLEGLGNTISKLSINASANGADVGLFGQYTGAGGAIRDVGLRSVNIVASGDGQSVGGIAGYSTGNVMNCYVTGQISSTGQSSFVGGLNGTTIFAVIGNSWSAVNISAAGAGSAAGGLTGHNDSGSALAFISQSYASGPVAVGDGGIAGGIAGQNISALIENSYATGAVTGGSNATVGGLVGTNTNDPHETLPATITASYSIGTVSGDSGSTVGGLIGADTSGAINTRDYWDLDTSGVSDPSRAAGNIANDPGIKGLTTAQFQSGLPKGFRPSIWSQAAAVNGGYPYLTVIPPL